MRIQNNIMAMNTHRMYTTNNNSVSRSAEKLSSGYRINRAGDDAAGLAISEKMRAQVRGLNMASKNSQDAISLVQTAEGALQEVHSMLQRMNELSVQSATGTNADFDRTQIAAEFEQLKGEIDQIAETTNFNNKFLLDGSLAGVGKTTTYAADKSAAMTNVSATNDAISTAIDFSKLANGDSITITKAGTAGTAIAFDKTAMTEAEFSAAVTAAGGSYANGKISVASGTGANSIVLTHTNAITSSIALTGNIDHGAGFTITDDSDNKTTFRLQKTGEPITLADGEVAFSVAANASAADIAESLATAINTAGGENTLSNVVAQAIGGYVNLNGAGITADSKVENFRGGLEIQVGAEEGNTLNVSVDAMNAKALKLDNITIDTQANAGKAISATRDAVNTVSDMRARLGAMQNRLDHKISNLDNTAENLQAAESRIRDVDIAKEMTTYTKNNILSQASTAMLAQANAAPQNVLSLLQ